MRSLQGLLTPFDRLEGFERRVHEPEANGEASAPGTVKPCTCGHSALRNLYNFRLGWHAMQGVELMNKSTEVFL